MAFPFGVILSLGKVVTDAVGLTGKGGTGDKIADVVESVVEVVAPPVQSKEDKQTAFDVIRQVVTEEKTDELIAKLVEQVKPKLPVWLRWLPIGYVLDIIFPEIVLGWLEDLLTKD